MAPARWLGTIVGGAVLLGPLARAAAAWWGLPEPFWALVPGGSADSLGLGAWLALDRWRRPDVVPIVGRPATAAAALVVWVAFAVAETRTPLPPALAVWRQVAQGLVFTWLVWHALRGRGPLRALLAHPAVVYVGRISYGAYLIHAFAPVVVHGFAHGLGADGIVPAGPLARAGLYAATTLATRGADVAAGRAAGAGAEGARAVPAGRRHVVRTTRLNGSSGARGCAGCVPTTTVTGLQPCAGR